MGRRNLARTTSLRHGQCQLLKPRLQSMYTGPGCIISAHADLQSTVHKVLLKFASPSAFMVSLQLALDAPNCTNLQNYHWQYPRLYSNWRPCCLSQHPTLHPILKPEHCLCTNWVTYSSKTQNLSMMPNLLCPRWANAIVQLCKKVYGPIHIISHNEAVQNTTVAVVALHAVVSH